MERFVIRGGVPLRGTVEISGAKNAALPCLAACLLTHEPVVLDNLPAVRDIQTTIHLLRTLGVSVEEQGPAGSAPPVRRRLHVQAQKLTSVEAPRELVRTMLGSTLAMVPVFLAGLLLIRGVPAVAYRKLAGPRLVVVAGLLRSPSRCRCSWPARASASSSAA